jgi:protein-disulfide isomerase
MEPENQIKTNELAIPIAIVIAGALIAAGVYFGPSRGTGTGTTPSTPPGAAQVDGSKVTYSGEPYIGKENAPLTMYYWFDYQCPYCKQNEETSMPQLIADYVNNGRIKIVFKDFQFLDLVQPNLAPDSQTLGQYARAVWAAAPDKFYDWHKAIFANQGQEDTGWATHAKILSITTSVLGADLANTVDGLVKANHTAYQAQLDKDKAEGNAIGVQGTPGFVIGNYRVDGAVPYEQIKPVIEAALNGK